MPLRAVYPKLPRLTRVLSGESPRASRRSQRIARRRGTAAAVRGRTKTRPTALAVTGEVCDWEAAGERREAAAEPSSACDRLQRGACRFAEQMPMG
eukprot:4744199-Prymnesium_polylepis.1